MTPQHAKHVAESICKGKPVERQGRKVSGLRDYSYDSGIARKGAGVLPLLSITGSPRQVLFIEPSASGGVMNTTIYVALFVATLVAASTGFEYWLSLARGMSRESSLHESAIAGTFLAGSAAVSYMVTLVS
jgi:hypothetical protein